jgi:aliphatic sulfonates family ABC transporter substrate-binding protein
LIGIEDGEYSKSIPGVGFEGRNFDAGSGVVEALRANVIQIGCSGPYPAIKAYGKDKDVVLLSGAATGGTELLVAANSPYKSVADLKGKKIGVNQLGSTVDSLVRYNLVQANLNPNTDVTIIHVAPAEQAELLKSGEIAAAAGAAPWPSVIKAKGARALLDWKAILDNGNYSAGSIYATKKFVDAHPNFIRKFLEVYHAITDRLNADRTKGDAEVLAAWGKNTKKKLDPAVAQEAFKTIKYTMDADPKGLQLFADIGFQVGVFKKKADLEGFVYEAR